MTRTYDRLSYVKGFRNRSDDDRLSLADSWSALALRGSVPGEDLPLGAAPGPDLQISLTTPGVAYTQNFNTLANTGTSGTLPTDWAFSETLANANALYSAGTGSSNSGDTWSFGAAASTDRAFGTLQSGNLNSTIGASFTNNTGATITSLLITYTGEQWRIGNTVAARDDRLDFEYSLNATGLTIGTWTNVDQLDFVNPIKTAAVAGALDGNLAANRTAISYTITGLTIANGATFWIRWLDFNASGADDGLAIDDFSLTPTTAAPPAETQTVVFNPTSVTQNEGNTGTTAYSFTVTRTGGTLGQVDFSGTIAAGGTDNADYVGGTAPTAFSGSILAGQTSATVTVNVQGDYTIEGDESFTLTLTAASNTDGTVTVNIGANDDATGNITNDDAAGTISVDDVSLAEGDAGPTAGSFTVHRTGGATGTVAANYVITLPGGVGGADGANVSGPLTGTVTFLEGETTASIPFTINGDVTPEPDETFTVALSSPIGGATIGDGSAAATIVNDDAPPVVSIGDASLAEGDDGVTYLVFTVSLSKVWVDPVTVDFDTADGSAVEDSDYLGLTGQVSFAPGDTSETISVPLIGDEVPENNETLTVTLSNPSGATIGDGTATGTISNDDGALYFDLSSGDFSQNWTNIGLITADDNWSGVPYIIGYLGDIDAGSTTNVDPRTLTGAALGAVDVIANQTNPNILNGGVAEFHIADPVVALQGSGTADAPSLVLYMDATGRADIRLQANLRDIDASTDNSAQQINVQYRTNSSASWTNVPGAYFSDVTTGPSATQATALDVTLPPGANGAATLEIRIMTTNAAGNDEWVGIDDIVVSSLVSPPSLSIANAAVFEGDAGNTPISFTVTRDGSSLGVVTANYTVTLGSGPFDAGVDDFAVGQTFAGMVSFADGQTTQTIVLNVDGNVGPEGDEGFTVTLSNAIGGTIADGVAIGTIVNDDGPPPLVTINDVTVTEGDAGTSLMTFTVTRTGGTGAFSVDYDTSDGSATAGEDYVATSGTLTFAAGDNSETISVTINGDTDSELSETLNVTLSDPTNFALITDPVGVGTILGDDPIFIHDIQGSGYFSPILLGEGITSFNTASAGTIIVRAVITAVDNDGPRQGYYLTEETSDWDANTLTSEGIFVMTRNDAGVGTAVSGVLVGDIVTVVANVMEYQAFQSMPRTMLVNPTTTPFSSGNPLPAPVVLVGMPNNVLTNVTPDYIFSTNFDATTALGFFETVEGMMVTIPNMVVADGFVSTSGGRPFFQAYSLDSANPDQINSRGGYTIAGDPPIGPPDTAETGDDTVNGGRHLHDGDVNPDVIELDFTGWAMAPPPGLATTATMGDQLGDVTGIIDFDFTDRKLFVTAMEPGGFVNGGIPVVETTALGNDGRSLTVATFNVENLDPGDGAARFTALANAIATNLNAPDIICIEEMQDNNGATASGGADASTTWQMLVDALNLATGSNYQWVDQEPNGSEGGEPGGNIRVGFLYNTDRVQLGDLAANATLAERRMYTDRIGDGVRDAGDLIAFSDNMLGGEISASDWAGTRRSLLGEFNFNGNTIFVTANHWPAKGGSGEFWQFNQNLETGNPLNSGWAQRNQVAQDVYAMLNLIEGSAPDAGIVAGGDFNDFYFYRPLTTVTGHTMADGTARSGGARFDNLTLTLSEAERYTYTFDGRAQAIDHIIANGLLSAVATYDVVHINTGYNAAGTGPDADPALSDHDPGLSSFDYREFSEVLNGTAGADTIDGFGGDDVITGGAGNDAIDGGAGSDQLYGQGDDDTLDGGAGNDLLDGGAGTDTAVFSGSLGFFDTVVGWVITSSEGSDILRNVEIAVEGSGQRNLLVGSTGFATIQAASDSAVTGDNIRLAAGSYSGTVTYDVGGLTVIGQTGSQQNVTYAPVGTFGISVFGANLVDTITTGAGDDSLNGGGGDDVMTGGQGHDTYHVLQAGDVVIEAPGGGVDIIFTAVSYALNDGSEVEVLATRAFDGTDPINLTGNSLANYMIGNDGANTLDGKAGADVMVGRAGNDTYIVYDAGDQAVENAGGGVDILFTSVSYALNDFWEVEVLATIAFDGTAPIDLTGNGLDNYMIGNDGANTMDGKGGSDVLVGRAGEDRFAFTTAPGAGNVDTIFEFVAADDTIALDSELFGLADGPLDPNAFRVGTAAADADDRIVYDDTTGYLYFDADGSGTDHSAILFAILQNAPALTASEFTVI